MLDKALANVKTVLAKEFPGTDAEKLEEVAQRLVIFVSLDLMMESMKEEGRRDAEAKAAKSRNTDLSMS